MGRRRGVLVGLLLLVATACTQIVSQIQTGNSAGFPKRLTDAEFWRLTSTFSEPSGVFPSDNFVSNETLFQHVIPRLTERTRSGGAYLGVGPDQNFSYIVALRPQVAFIVDIRRQNLALHLMYKALIELSRDRAEFLSRLFSRPRPPNIARTASVAALVTAYATVAPSEKLFQENLRAVQARLTERHHFALSSEDLESLAEVYTAFYRGGPDIEYSIRNGPRLRFPTYAELIQQTDAAGVPRSYLATEQHFAVLKDLEENNLIVPIVGDFGGEKALPAVADYLNEQRLVVSAFYLSNVEMYLFQNPLSWRRFYANLGRLPANEGSSLIRSYNLRPQSPSRTVRIQLATVLDSLQDLVRAVNEGRVARYVDVIERSE